MFVYVCIAAYIILYPWIPDISWVFLVFSDPAPACKAAGSFSLTWLNEQAHQMVPNAKNLDLKNLKINLHVCQTSQSLGLFLSNWDGKTCNKYRENEKDIGRSWYIHTISYRWSKST